MSPITSLHHLRKRAESVNARPEILLVDTITLKEIYQLDYYLERSLEGTLLFMGLPVRTCREPIRFLESDEDPVLLRLMCLQAVCRDTGRYRYFDDPETSPEFLPREEKA